MNTVSELAWRQRPPSNFKNLLETYIKEKNVNGLRCLINCALNDRHIQLIDNLSSEIKSLITDQRLRISILSNSTVDFLLPAIRVNALRYGILVDILHHEFGQYMESVYFTNKVYADKKIDLMLMAFDIKAFNNSNSQVEKLIIQIKDKLGVPLAVQTVPQIITGVFGSSDKKNDCMRKRIEEFNTDITIGSLSSNVDIVIDIAQLAAVIGLENWYDERLFNFAKIPFAPEYIPHYGEWVMRPIAALRGQTGKCLVLDIDNTLWGGVIGEDGLEGIVLGQGDATGEAFIEFQKTIISLKERGIILAVCSKNDEVNAREPFVKHPDMVLKEEDISIFVSNWNDKATNIKNIANILNIGLDSMVFLDDNPAEREQVRLNLPMVNVVELPEDPAYFSRTLLLSGAFESLSFTEDDKIRSKSYAARALVIKLEKECGNYEDYLRSLEMVATIQPFDAVGCSRITQLINKTNQFNLTTKRYTEDQVKSFEQDDKTLTLQIRLKDKFSDHGMVSVVMGKIENNTLVIGTWLMSCRVLKRNLEDHVMNYVIKWSKTNSIEKVVGKFIDSTKNSMVRDFYKERGFVLVKEDGKQTIWSLKITDYVFAHELIKVEGSNGTT